MTTRRDLLQLAAGAAAGAVFPDVMAADAKPGAQSKSLLILGGTGFIGPHLTDEALRLNWKVTHFNRGKRAAGGVPGVETLTGDRRGQLDALRGRTWDVVIDDTGYIPKYVKMSAELLAPNVGYCLYISSISAYASFAKPNDIHSPTGKLTNPDVEEINGETYGPMKALCEQYTAEAFKGRLSIVRPGYIVGPLDTTDRFTYWPVRASKGGEMLAPGTPKDPVQVIDVRDLSTWMMSLVEARTNGYFNAVSPPGAFTMGDLIAASVRASPKAGAKATWGVGGFSRRPLEAGRSRPAALVAHERGFGRRLTDVHHRVGQNRPALTAIAADGERHPGVVSEPAGRSASEFESGSAGGA